MEIRIKLMGLLREKKPPRGCLEIIAGSSVQDILNLLEIPPEHVHLVMVNGQHTPDRGQLLHENDELMIMPPVGGG